MTTPPLTTVERASPAPVSGGFVPRPPSVLVIAPGIETRSLLARELVARGYGIALHTDGLPGERATRRENPDLILMDADLPDISGHDLCARIRAWSFVPIVLMSTRDNSQERVQGLRAGADDYVVRPFSTEELIERIAAILRRSVREARQFRFEDLILDVEHYRCFRGGGEILLTPTEFAILETLARLPGKVISRQTLASVVWPEAEYIDDRMLDSHVTHLRTKLEASGGRRIVVAVRGVGLTLR